VGHVRTAASTVIGGPVVATELGRRTWDFGAAVKKLGPRVKREFAGMQISRPKLVCYSYPKAGVMYEMEGPSGKSRAIYDVADLTRIPERPERPGVEGSYAWSFYDALSPERRKEGMARFGTWAGARKGIGDRRLTGVMRARSFKAAMGEIDFRLKISKTALLGYCPHYAYTHARSHHCFVLHGQQTNDYCAVATCQMVLCYYRYYYTQDEIAPQLGYVKGSGCPPDQSAGYEALTCNHLDATYDTAPTFAKACDEIDKLHPMKSGIGGHARACAGYSYSWWAVNGVKEKKLYIYDPSPWNADYALGGTVMWEDWDSITHTNFVFTKIKCP